MTFSKWYENKYPSGTVGDYVEYDYYSHLEITPVEVWWLDKQLEEAFNAGRDFQKAKEYEFTL